MCVNNSARSYKKIEVITKIMIPVYVLTFYQISLQVLVHPIHKY